VFLPRPVRASRRHAVISDFWGAWWDRRVKRRAGAGARVPRAYWVFIEIINPEIQQVAPVRGADHMRVKSSRRGKHPPKWIIWCRGRACLFKFDWGGQAQMCRGGRGGSEGAQSNSRANQRKFPWRASRCPHNRH